MKRLFCAIACFGGILVNAHAADLNLPDPLISNSGLEIDSDRKWESARRPEILELFREHVYGRKPAGTEDGWNSKALDSGSKTVEITKGVMDGTADLHAITINMKRGEVAITINVSLFIPVDKEPGSTPCFVLICNRDPVNIDPTRKTKSPFWPAEEIIKRGFATAAFWNADVDPDQHDGFKNGVHGLLDESRDESSWGTIAAWAWGASLVYDAVITEGTIDPDKVGIIGHSRGGKTSLWAGAEDTRFAMVISNESGSTGAALARRMQGETIAKINKGFPHWFNRNYRNFNDNENEMPVDQHMLAALIAPRLLYIGSAQEDTWADPEGEFLSGFYARPVYELYGYKGLGDATFPEADQPVHGDRVAYHMRSGKHNLTEYDWGQYMDFADKYWK
jgi:hypothetical protein